MERVTTLIGRLLDALIPRGTSCLLPGPGSLRSCGCTGQRSWMRPRSQRGRRGPSSLLKILEGGRYGTGDGWRIVQ